MSKKPKSGKKSKKTAPKKGWRRIVSMLASAPKSNFGAIVKLLFVCLLLWGVIYVGTHFDEIVTWALVQITELLGALTGAIAVAAVLGIVYRLALRR